MYTCVSEGYEGYPCDKQQEVNRDIFAWHTPEIDFPTFMWGLFRPWGEREQEFGLSLSLSVGSAAVPLEVLIGQQRQKEQEKKKIKSESEADRKVRLLSSKSDCFIATQGVSGSRQQTMGQQNQYWHSP